MRETREQTLATTRNLSRRVPGLPAAGEPRHQGSPRSLRRIALQVLLISGVTSPAQGGEMLTVCPKPDDRLRPEIDGVRGLHASPAPGSPRPSFSPPLSWPLPQRRSALQSSPPPPESRSPHPQLPAALTLARARAGGGGVPAAHRAAGRGSPARELAAAADPGGGDEGGGRRAPSRRPAGGLTVRVVSQGPPPLGYPGAQPGHCRAWAAGAETAGRHPAPAAPGSGTPPDPPVTSVNRGAGQSSAS